MAHGRVRLSGDEMKIFRTIQDILDKKISQKEGAQKLEKSTRQIRRLQKRVVSEGHEGVVHKLVGRKSNNALKPDVVERIIKLWEDKYRSCGFNFTHFTQRLNETERVKVSKDTVRILLRERNLVDKKPRKRSQHRKERPRKERFGELLQQDTSPHDWLGTKEKQQLVAITDDATSKVLFAQLFDHDGTLANMKALNHVCHLYGLPMAIYTDRASWFHNSGQGQKLQQTHKAMLTAMDVNKGETQIQRALNELGIELIPAYSPQAKGRIERMNRTFQDRLISELRLHNITNMSLANEYIEKIYLPDHNRRFSKEPQDKDSAFLTLANLDCLEKSFCLKFESRVRNDNVISRVKHYKLQLLPIPTRPSWAQARVKVWIHLDGSITVRHAQTDQLIPYKILELRFIKESKHSKTALI